MTSSAAHVVVGPGGSLGSRGNVIPLDAAAKGWERACSRYDLRDRARDVWRVVGDDDEFRSLRLCGLGVRPHADGGRSVELRRTKDGAKAAAIGTVSCGSPWACSVCSARVREKRRVGLHRLVQAGTERGYRWVFFTGTLRHRRGQGPRQQRAALEACWKAITTGKQAQARKESGAVLGTVRSIEMQLDGPAGPHGHVHGLVLVAGDVSDDDLSVAMDAMGKRWSSWAERKMDGLRPSDAHGWHWEVARSAAEAMDYATKSIDGAGWTVAHEVARGDVKTGKEGSRTPMEMLRAAIDEVEVTGDLGAMMRMADFARATRGMRAIVVSRSLTQILGDVLDERTDQELADEVEELGDEWETVLTVSGEAWAHAVRAFGTVALLNAARAGEQSCRSLFAQVAARAPRAGPRVAA